MKFSSVLIKSLACTFVFIALGLTSCKKDTIRKYSNDIYGPWEEQTGLRRHLGFSKDGNLIVRVPDEFLKIQLYFGTFSIELDTLTYKLTETADKYINGTYNKTPLDTPVEISSTYIVRGDSLVLSTANHSVDSPITTRAVFYRPVDEY